ncbi:MAG: type VI secretion lipoprotein TssJ, partial [Methylococcales bacterium]|nr:type VI secretion lipoprotein TssJ [Methylococcales bacterium]
IDPACINDKHFFIAAGHSENITIDRVGGARYLGIVVGYADLKGARVARLIPIVTLNKRKVIDVTKQSPSMLTDVLRPASLALKLSLGKKGITQLNIEAN